jgi:hypothetical protein
LIDRLVKLIDRHESTNARTTHFFNHLLIPNVAQIELTSN